MGSIMQTAELEPVKKNGRPTKYTDQVLRKTEEYLTNYKETGDLIPSIAGLSQEIDITRETIHVWSNDKNKKKFSDMIQRLKAIQERSLLTGGLSSEFNTRIAQLCLSKHGYHDNPVHNQGPAGITVQVNRGSVVLKSGAQTLEIAEQTPGTTLEHQPD